MLKLSMARLSILRLGNSMIMAL